MALVPPKLETSVQFFAWSQNQAVSTFSQILKGYFPHSNPLYNRIRAPHNVPERHCVFAATFPPPEEHSIINLPEEWTLLFADRSRHLESQIFAFNPLFASATSGLSPAQRKDQDAILLSHTKAVLDYTRHLKIPEAPGWPFSPILRLSCLHERMGNSIIDIVGGEESKYLLRATKWRLWFVDCRNLPPAPEKPLPEGYTFSRVPADQLDIVLSTSIVERQAATMLALPSMSLLDETGKLAAWAYIGIDGAFATLYVLPEYRGKGLATIVGRRLLGSLANGDFEDMGFDGSSGWVHSDVHRGNLGSEGCMKSLGGWTTYDTIYFQIDTHEW